MLLTGFRLTVGALHRTVIDYLALALTHGLILLALIRAVSRNELDREPELDLKNERPSDSKLRDVKRGGKKPGNQTGGGNA